MQRLAEGIQGQRLHVVLDVGMRLLRAAAREGAQLGGAMLMGPLRRSRYSRPMPALPHSELAMVLSVRAPRTL